MTDERAPERPADAGDGGAGGWMSNALLAVVFLVVLYVLSIGPVAGVATRRDWDVDRWMAFYRPVIWLHDHTVLKEPLEWYVHLFTGGK